jgi:hypothetical protein
MVTVIMPVMGPGSFPLCPGRIGGPDTLRDQLRHLLKAASLPSVPGASPPCDGHKRGWRRTGRNSASNKASRAASGAASRTPSVPVRRFTDLIPSVMRP